jgi:ABC-type glycerol-3-phosphate transport system substrate-binding protein
MARTTRRDGADLTAAGFPPFWGSGGNNLWLMPFWQLGGETTSADGERVTINSEQGIRALDWLKKLHDMQGGYAAVERLRATLARGSTGGNNPLFVEGKAVHYFATFAERGQWFKTNAPDLTFGFAPWPKPPGGRDANYGSSHTFTVAAGAKNPNGAWGWIEFISQPAVNLRFAKEYDRVPIRPATTRSKDYTEGDPFRELIAQQMPFRKFVIPAPGGIEIVDLTSQFLPDVMAGKVTVRDGLAQAAQQIQQILDKWKR